MKNSFKKVKDLELEINSVVSGKFGKQIIKFYSSRLRIPEEICSQYIKQKIASNFNSKLLNFTYSSSLFHILIMAFKYFFFIFYILFFSKKISNNKKKFSLLIDDIQQLSEFSRWKDLENCFPENETIYISRFTSKDLPKNKNIACRKVLHGYSRQLALNIGLKKLVSDLFYIFFISLKLNVNFFNIHLYLINDYLYYISLFERYKSKYLIQDRHLGRTNALKNYLFKLSGGSSAACIQKNIVQHNGYALFYDVDIFFSYGNKTAEDMLKLGGRIEKVCPVGSLALNNSTFYSKQKSKVKDIDILYIGINAINSNKTDWSGYYESIKWLVKLSNQNKNLNIVIKHHPSWTFDIKEEEIIKNSKIKHLDKNKDSYDAANQSNFILTYGSSMGYELMGYGFDVIFMDPDFKNPFINNFVRNDEKVISEYNKLENMLNNPFYLNNNKINKEDYCYQNKDVSKNIYEILVGSE